MALVCSFKPRFMLPVTSTRITNFKRKPIVIRCSKPKNPGISTGGGQQINEAPTAMVIDKTTTEEIIIEETVTVVSSPESEGEENESQAKENDCTTIDAEAST